MKHRWQYMLLAIVLAVFSWYLVTGREKVETLVSMSLEIINPPQGLIIDEGMVDTIQVRVRGPKGLVRALSTRQFAYPLDMGKLEVGENIIEFEEKRIPLSKAYEVVEIKPKRLTLTVDRLTEKNIQVIPDWKGDLNDNYQLLGTNVSPKFITIRGPESILKQITQVKAQALMDFDEPPSAWSEDVIINLPSQVEIEPRQVRVDLNFGPKLKQVWIKVHLDVDSPDSLTVKVRQDFVRLLLEGPVSLFEIDEFRKDVKATLRISDAIASGNHDLEYQVELPKSCRLERRNPETVEINVKKK